LEKNAFYKERYQKEMSEDWSTSVQESLRDLTSPTRLEEVKIFLEQTQAKGEPTDVAVQVSAQHISSKRNAYL
jgi:hypothetical protein